MHRELNAASSLMQLSVATPMAKLLHRTIAVKLPGGFKAPKYVFFNISFIYYYFMVAWAHMEARGQLIVLL